jgi:hypothetical protein
MPDITLTLTAGQVTRVQDALVTQRHIPAPTIEDARQFLISRLKSLVFNHEQQEAEEALVIPPFDIP